MLLMLYNNIQSHITHFTFPLGEWPSSPYSFRQVTEVKVGWVRSNHRGISLDILRYYSVFPDIFGLKYFQYFSKLLCFLFLWAAIALTDAKESRKCEGREGDERGGGEEREKKEALLLSLSFSSSAFLSRSSFALSALLRIGQSNLGSQK